LLWRELKDYPDGEMLPEKFDITNMAQVSSLWTNGPRPDIQASF
jgi:hypothetical protein